MMEHYVFPTPCTHLCSNTSMICYFNTLWGSFCTLSLKTISIQGMYNICNCITKQVSKSMDDKLTLSYYTSATSFAIFLYYNNPIIPKSTLKHIHVAAVLCLFAPVL